MKRKTLLYLFIGISAFVAIYLYYVDIDRKKSIERYFSQPQVGDVYKIKRNREDGKSWLSYLKLVEISGDRLVFNPSKMMADASADYILNHYDTHAPVIYSANELVDIKTGKWNNYQKDNTTLIEIVRK